MGESVNGFSKVFVKVVSKDDGGAFRLPTLNFDGQISDEGFPGARSGVTAEAEKLPFLMECHQGPCLTNIRFAHAVDCDNCDGLAIFAIQRMKDHCPRPCGPEPEF
jgi:hypothetical protein